MIRFLLDAHLPFSLAVQLRRSGYDTVHTSELPTGNRTPDAEINLISVHEERVVVTKDADFVNSLLLHRIPHKLLLISTGNISNQVLLSLIEDNLVSIVDALQNHDFVELGRDQLIIHR